MARLFFAVGVSPDVISGLESLLSDLGKGAVGRFLRLIEPNQAHYTLQFLGEVSPSRQLDAVRAGRAAAAGAGASKFDLSPHGLGVFPDDRRPHTLFIGADTGASEITRLASSLKTELAREDFEIEPRPFVPHLTLARLKGRPPSSMMRALLFEPRESIGSLHVENFMLMESNPSRGGVRYACLEVFRLEMPCMPSRSPSTGAPKS